MYQLGDPDFSEFVKHFRVNWNVLRKSLYDFIDIFQLHVDVSTMPKEPMIFRQNDNTNTSFNPEFPDFSLEGISKSTEVEQDEEFVLEKLHWEPVNPLPYTLKYRGRNSFREWSNNDRASHDTPISVVVILDEKIQTHVPVNIQVIREDISFGSFSSLAGPKYEDVIRELTEADFDLYPLMKAQPKLWKGKFGCIIHSFYQHGKQRIDALKPAASESGMIIMDIGEKKAIDYYKAGFLSNMDYQIRIILAATGNLIEVRAPHWVEINVNEEVFDKLPQTIYSSVTLTKAPEDSSLPNKEFLSSLVSGENQRSLFVGARSLTPYVRFFNAAGKATSLLSQQTSATLVNAVKQIMASKLSFGATYNSALNMNDFDWKTPCEFVCAVSSSSIDKEDYEEIVASISSVGWPTIENIIEPIVKYLKYRRRLLSSYDMGGVRKTYRAGWPCTLTSRWAIIA